MKTKTSYRKLSADCERDLKEKAMKAAGIQKRTLSNFIRLAVSEKIEEVFENANNRN
tara:strand:+ start:183 stop:353 length:171 start_codon:yes stop_codon:yes gene_type:complete